jgi:glyoxylase-like metal-dependent hydrolase (beta-lactamase superfamily II)
MGSIDAASGLAVAVIAITAATQVIAAPSPSADAPQARALARGVWIIPGGIRPNRQPDGNTVIFEANDGLVVMDTGRHIWQRQAILDFAKRRNRPIVGVINSHWHLDHVSGNPDIKHAYPDARVYASNAIDKALAGFLPNSARDGQKYLDQGGMPPDTAEDIRNDIATIAHGAALRPDVVILASGVRSIGGLKFQINLAAHAATDGDVWVYEPHTRTAAVGDLVTLPAPFLDTACSAGWRAALDQVWATPFRIVVPGHGSPMSRDQFAVWRSAFNALIDCSASSRVKTECAADWTSATAVLRGSDPLETRQAQGMTDYYVGDVLRAHGGDSAYCTKV